MAPRSGSPSRRCACSLRPEGGDLVFLRSRRAPYHLERGTHRVLRMRRIRDRVAKADLVALAQDLVDGAGLRSVDTGTLQGCAELTGRVAGIDAEALDGVAAEARGEQRVVLGRLALLRQTLLRERVELAASASGRSSCGLSGFTSVVSSPSLMTVAMCSTSGTVTATPVTPLGPLHGISIGGRLRSPTTHAVTR